MPFIGWVLSGRFVYDALRCPAIGQVPARHVHPDTLADLLRLQSLTVEATRLRGPRGRLSARPGKARWRPGNWWRWLPPLAMRRTWPEVNRIIRQRQKEATTAETVAEGTADGVTTLRRQVAAGIE
ncbi:hypothetical protein [Plantactinospora soyae]|uniref:Uncharacterized protein n=1 Tax=Plantactinospora soyae TaxID=1544732 RepID=A0A927MD41_9ACTN|nr:hypothetical protein [Plantactinospora soyae]MBE1492289.1 hypothetical protein [Plantactinospora soyae]